MALQSSGTIKMSEINVELGRTSTANISLDDAESGVYATINTASPSYPSNTQPASISEWYSYDHSAAAGYEGLISTASEAASNEACLGLSATGTVYKDGSSSKPVSNDQLYSDSSLTTNFSPKSGFDVWYKYEDVAAGNIPYSLYLVQGGGGECVIQTVVAC